MDMDSAHYNTHCSSVKAFFKILKRVCENLGPFSHKSICGVRLFMAYSQFQFILKVSGPCAGHWSSSIPNSSNHVFMDINLLLEHVFAKHKDECLSKMGLYPVGLTL